MMFPEYLLSRGLPPASSFFFIFLFPFSFPSSSFFSFFLLSPAASSLSQGTKKRDSFSSAQTSSGRSGNKCPSCYNSTSSPSQWCSQTPLHPSLYTVFFSLACLVWGALTPRLRSPTRYCLKGLPARSHPHL